MTYSIKNFAQTTTYTVNDSSANTTALSITLLGKSLTNYGTYLNQNFVWLTENFSSPANSPPQNPVQGQHWWDSTYKFLNVYDGTSWNTVYGNLSSLYVNTSVTASTVSATTINTPTLNATTVNATTVNAANIGNTGANLIGYLTTVNQPNVVSLGTLVGLTSSGTIIAPTIGNTGANLTGYITTASQPNITSLGTLTQLTSSGNISATTANVYASYIIANNSLVTSSLIASGNITSRTANVYANYVIGNTGYAGLVLTNAQPYITTVGTLSSVSVSGGATVGNVITTNGVFYPNGLAFTTGSGTTYSNANVASYLPTYTGTFGALSGLTVNGAIVPSSNASINIGGSGTQYFNNIYAVNFLGTSTTAKYADLAEKYLPDADYEVGTVMMVGGSAEITQHNGSKVRAIGVISEYPAYMMNADQEGGVYVALKGRVPVKVVGPVKKGQALIGTAHGLAVAQTDDSQWMFAIALENFDDNTIQLIEAVIL
jgi:hypothetical protein